MIADRHADAQARVVEYDERSEHQVQFAHDDFCAGDGFLQTGTGRDERRFGTYFTKSQQAVPTRHRRKNFSFRAPCALDYRPGAHLFKWSAQWAMRTLT